MVPNFILGDLLVSIEEPKRRKAAISNERDVDEVNAYMPQRFLTRRSPRTKSMVPNFMSRRNRSYDVSSKWRNVNSSHIDTEEDKFTNDILSIARSSLVERHRRERSRNGTRSLFIAPWLVHHSSVSFEEKSTMV